MITELVTPAVCAERLGIKPATLREWRNTRGLPCYRISARVCYYDWHEVEAWIRGHRATRTATGETVLPSGRGRIVVVPGDRT